MRTARKTTIICALSWEIPIEKIKGRLSTSNQISMLCGQRQMEVTMEDEDREGWDQVPAAQEAQDSDALWYLWHTDPRPD